jgi:hypothetical protein
MLCFLAPDRARMAELEQAVRQYLAWDSIVRESKTLNLDAFQGNQASTKRQDAEDTIRARIPETYCWLLVSTQPDPQGEVEWVELRLQGTGRQEALAVHVATRPRVASISRPSIRGPAPNGSRALSSGNVWPAMPVVSGDTLRSIGAQAGHDSGLPQFPQRRILDLPHPLAPDTQTPANRVQ